MIAPPERSEERDAALTALLPRVPAQGWTFAALRDALRNIGADPREAELLFPGGAVDMIEAWLDRADRRMAAAEIEATRLGARVRALIAWRLADGRADKAAARRAAGVLALPRNAALSARTLARTVDAIWHAAGDTAADFNWYTKRATLAAIYGATLLFWLHDGSEDDAATLAFLDRRLARRARVGRLIERVRRAA